MVYLRVAVCSYALVILAGCGSSRPELSKLVPVQGKVTLNDGTPLPDGALQFVPVDEDALKPPYPMSPIEADGSYKITIEGRNGAPVGKYRVMFLRGEDRKTWSKVANQYFGRKGSLEIEVTENKPEGAYDLKLQSRK